MTNNTSNRLDLQNQHDARVADLEGHELPIEYFHEQIVEAVDSNQATVITAETGAGKSTQVPQMLARAGYDVIVTQPRVMAARTVAERVKDEAGGEVTVAYRTAREKSGPDNAQITFCTDGLQVVRSLTEGKLTASGREKVLVIDEVHEWNTNIEVLLAWAKANQIKLVTMSATLAGQELSDYFGGAPAIEVPGRTYEVSKKEGGSVVSETLKLIEEGKNTLVFLPGKKEIDDVAHQLRAKGVEAPIIPLHGQLSPEAQREAFVKHKTGKIILATNVAQTSITIEDIDAVVDSGLERQVEERQGVEGLYMKPISQADCLQRAGRAGRTKPGEYVLASLDNRPVVPMDQRDPYPVPEILRTKLDRTMLRLSASGFDMEGMDFFHQPDPEDIKMSRLRLQTLGALDVLGKITDIGREMNRLPLETHLARMMVEVKKYPKSVQNALVECIAIRQSGGIIKNGKYNTGWQKLTNEKESDYLAQREVLFALDNIPKSSWGEYDILTKNVFATRQNMHSIRNALRLGKQEGNRVLSQEEREQLMKSIASGLIDQVWFNRHGKYVSALDMTSRELSSSSVCRDSIIVAEPFDLHLQGNRGEFVLNLLQSASKVDPKWLIEIAPQLIRLSDTGRRQFNPNTGEPIEFGELKFGNLTVGEQEIAPDIEAVQRRIVDILLQTHHKRTRQYSHWLQQLTELSRWVTVFDTELADNISGRLRKVLTSKLEESNICNLHTALANAPSIGADDLLSEEEYQVIMDIAEGNPDEITVGDSVLAVDYSRGYADISINYDCLDVIKEDSLPTLKATRFSVSMPDGSIVQYIGLDTARIEVAEQISQATRESYEKSLIESGECLVDFGVEFRGSRCWVVGSDGRLREPDEAYYKEKRQRWNVVYPDEIAIVLTNHSKDPNVGTFSIEQHSNAPTQAQLDAVRQIEQDLGAVKYAWRIGDDGEEEKVVNDILQIDNDIILDAITNTDRPYLKLLSRTGLLLETWSKTDRTTSETVWSSNHITDTGLVADGREADIVERFRINSRQVLVVVKYHKYGHSNFALKLIDEVADEDQEPTEEVNDDLSLALEALAAKFSKY